LIRLYGIIHVNDISAGEMRKGSVSVMDREDLRTKKVAIRKEIKERMQRELDDRKKEIKKRIKQEDISVEEKRERYRSEAHREKLRLMDMAKSEFKARKRMLGEAAEESIEEVEEDFEDTPDMAPEWQMEEQALMEGDDAPEEPSDGIDPESAFVLEDTTEDREALRELQSPIGEIDALPPEAERWAESTGVDDQMEEEALETRGLFHFIINLIIHPIQTLDEFDEYIASPGGLMKVAIFYFASLMPMVLFLLVAENIGAVMPGGLMGSVIGSSMQQPSTVMVLGKTVLDLLLYSFSIAIVNYFVTNEANVITLTTYFAFVEGVTGVIIYTLVVAAILAAVIAPPLLAVVGLLFLAFLGWRIALNIIVLMCAYGYGIFSAFLLIIGAYVVRKLIYIFVSGLFGASLEETLYSP